MAQFLELADSAASAACAASAALSAEYPWLLVSEICCSANPAVGKRSDRRCHPEILLVSEGCLVALVVYLVVVFAALCVASDDTEMSQDLAIRTMFKHMRQVSSIFATFSMIVSMSQELCSSACSHQAASAAATQVLMDSGPMAQVPPPPMAMESRPSLLIVLLGECTKRKPS